MNCPFDRTADTLIIEAAIFAVTTQSRYFIVSEACTIALESAVKQVSFRS
jgi:hypothetical protein